MTNTEKQMRAAVLKLADALLLAPYSQGDEFERAALGESPGLDADVSEALEAFSDLAYEIMESGKNAG